MRVSDPSVDDSALQFSLPCYNLIAQFVGDAYGAGAPTGRQQVVENGVRSRRAAKFTSEIVAAIGVMTDQVAAVYPSNRWIIMATKRPWAPMIDSAVANQD
jgi:hypothetical protein